MRISLIAAALTTLFASSAFALTANKRASYLATMDSDEKSAYHEVLTKSGQAEGDKYLITRDFTHQCKAVKEGSLPAILLPAFPGQDFNIAYLDNDEKPMVLFSLRKSTEELERSCKVDSPSLYPPA